MNYKSEKIYSDVNTNLWDAFVDYLENTYFPGAAVLLDKRTIAFEYQAFCECYA